MTALRRIGVVGANGFLGGELVRLLAEHPGVELAALTAGRSAGRPLAELRPGLAGVVGARALEATDADRLAEACELVFLALPHGESAVLADALLDRDTAVIDLGSDFRLRDPADYPRYYGREHPCPARLDGAFYSLPELTGGPPPDSPLVASPGCFATALALACVPLVPALAADARLAVFGVTGSSGSGVAPSAAVHHALRPTNMVAYKALTHQHLGELRQLMRAQHGRSVAVDFVPHSGPLVRGIHLTLQVRRAELDGDPLALYRQRYEGQPLIGVREGPVALGAVIGSMRVELGVTGDDEVAVVTVAIDNLLRGGSGQAVQSMNLRWGLPQTLGLPRAGIWP